MDKETRKVIALGFFDGVHLGHQALLRRAVDRSREKGFTPAVFTFDRSPRAFVTGAPVPLLTTPEERRQVVRELFDLRPGKIITYLDLRRPIYEQTAAYGHFGRTDVDLPWERTDMTEALKAAL